MSVPRMFHPGTGGISNWNQEIKWSPRHSGRVCLVCFTFPFLLKEIWIRKTCIVCGGGGLYYSPQFIYLSACGLSVIGRRQGVFRPVSDWFPSASLFLTALARVCLPLSQLPTNYLFPLWSLKLIPLSPLSKMTFIPYLASLFLEFSCWCESPVHTYCIFDFLLLEFQCFCVCFITLTQAYGFIDF